MHVHTYPKHIFIYIYIYTRGFVSCLALFWWLVALVAPLPTSIAVVPSLFICYWPSLVYVWIVGFEIDPCWSYIHVYTFAKRMLCFGELFGIGWWLAALAAPLPTSVTDVLSLFISCWHSLVYAWIMSHFVRQPLITHACICISPLVVLAVYGCFSALVVAGLCSGGHWVLLSYNPSPFSCYVALIILNSGL